MVNMVWKMTPCGVQSVEVGRLVVLNRFEELTDLSLHCQLSGMRSKFQKQPSITDYGANTRLTAFSAVMSGAKVNSRRGRS